MKKQYQRLIHKVLEGGKIMSSRQIHDAIIDLPSFETSCLHATEHQSHNSCEFHQLHYIKDKIGTQG